MKTACLFLKAPRLGTVKTRLARDIGPERAVAVYRTLVAHQAGTIPAEWEVVVYFAPRDAEPEMRDWLEPLFPRGLRLEPQCGGDLGRRLEEAVRQEFQRGTTRLFLLGGDCPGISSEYLAEADKVLNGNDLVIGPAEDGGYVLLGLTAPAPTLFAGIAWSTEVVLEQTLAAARRQGLHVGLLPPLEDVDDAESWRRQRSSLENPESPG